MIGERLKERCFFYVTYHHVLCYLSLCFLSIDEINIMFTSHLDYAAPFPDRRNASEWMRNITLHILCDFEFNDLFVKCLFHGLLIFDSIHVNAAMLDWTLSQYRIACQEG